MKFSFLFSSIRCRPLAFTALALPTLAFSILSPGAARATEFTIDFETDENGVPLTAGSVNLFANPPYENLFGPGSGVTLSTDNHPTQPLNLYNTEGIGGADDDLERNSDSANPGEWAGGNLHTPGAPEDIALGNALIINTNSTISTPNDDGGGGHIIFSFDVPLRSFGFDFVDMDSATAADIVFTRTGFTPVRIGFEEFQSGGLYARPGVLFGNRNANAILDITAASIGLASFDVVSIEATSSGGPGTVYFDTLIPVPEPSSTLLIISSLFLATIRRRR